MLPQGPHFYTGLLQAAGYLLLDSQKKKILIISQQSVDPKNILIDNTVYGPIFGRKYKNSTEFISKIGIKLSQPGQKSLSDEMSFQLPFLRIITKVDELLHISIGDKTSQIQIKKLSTWIKNNSQEYNIVFLANIELPKPAKSKKSDEQEQIIKILQTTSLSTPLFTIFQKMLSYKKKKPEIIAYVNPGDFGKTASLTTRYICAVG